MHPRPIRCRRLRRTDADAVFALLEAAGLCPPQPDRATLHRFRLLAADLGADCYLALADETLAGLVHVTYARHLLDGQRATVELLLVDPAHSGADVLRALAQLVAERARRRGCRGIDWRTPPGGDVATAFAAQLDGAATTTLERVEIPGSAE